MNSGGQDCLTSGEQDVSYIQDKIKLNNAEKLYRNKGGMGGGGGGGG